jgi:hypothetical protein
MSAFLDQFRPDPELDGRLVWRTTKPLLRDAVVAVAPPYPDYPKLKVSTSGRDTDPYSPSARDPSSQVEVALYADAGNGYGSLHERAWEFVLAHSAAIEAALRRKLFAWHGKQMASFLTEDLPDAPPEYQKYWKVVERQVALGDPSAVDQLFKLVSVGLADSGLDDCGFSSFEFQTGWDRDHGLGILMHKDRVLAAGGMGEMICGDELVTGVRVVQGYDLDEGDLVL